MKLFKGIDLGTGIVIGIGAAMIAPSLMNAMSGVARPLAKSAIKGGFVAFDRARVWMAEAVEVAEDLAAEARAEMEEEHAGEAAGEAMAAAATKPAGRARPAGGGKHDRSA
jgi:hypothetical protein